MAESRTILLVEDSEDDALLMRMALEQVTPTSQIQVVPDALCAMYYLNGEGHYADRATYPMPYLIICDLVLPGISGLKLIEWVRHNPDFEHLLVIALTELCTRRIMLPFTGPARIRLCISRRKQARRSRHWNFPSFGFGGAPSQRTTQPVSKEKTGEAEGTTAVFL